MPDITIINQELIDILQIKTPSPVERIRPNWQGAEDLEIWVKRDDLIHPIISGNKWRKLKYALISAAQHGVKSIVSFGGGFSNHLHALGYCCYQLGISFTAIVRGNYADNPSPMLMDLQRWNTNIQYVTKVEYQKRDQLVYLDQLRQQYQGALIIPEGGSQHQALDGVGEIISELKGQYQYILMPVGSGGTLAGLIHATQSNPELSKLIGIGVLKGEGYLEELVTQLLPYHHHSNWQINHKYHFNGYGKSTKELVNFCLEFEQQTGIQIEPVYSGKLFWGLRDMCQSGAFPTGSKVLALHTGGLQGLRVECNKT